MINFISRAGVPSERAKAPAAVKKLSSQNLFSLVSLAIRGKKRRKSFVSLTTQDKEEENSSAARRFYILMRF
jgi:hypothetical protein